METKSMKNIRAVADLSAGFKKLLPGSPLPFHTALFNSKNLSTDLSTIGS
jgi:hypothetical protein